MAKAHIVSCHACREQFDTFRGGYYNSETNQYTCKQCGRGGGRSERGVRIGMRQTMVGMVLKILFGLLFFCVSVDSGEGAAWDFPYFLTCLILGGALIAWAVVPWIRANRESAELIALDECMSVVVKDRKKRAEQTAEPKICPGCGATSIGPVCEYCGTRLC